MAWTSLALLHTVLVWLTSLEGGLALFRKRQDVLPEGISWASRSICVSSVSLVLMKRPSSEILLFSLPTAYIGQLRQKIEPDPSGPRFLLTEPGVGYRLLPEDN